MRCVLMIFSLLPLLRHTAYTPEGKVRFAMPDATLPRHCVKTATKYASTL